MGCDRSGGRPGDAHESDRGVLVELGHRRQQGLGVGVAHVGEELSGSRLLDDLAGVHDEHAVGPAGDDAHVVGDEDDRHLQLPAELVDEIEDLGLDGDVERGRGLVGDEQLGLAGEGHGDHDALAQAARELVGVGVEALLGARHVDESRTSRAR